jgi:3-oxoacyl-[acyl-carrier-protein] synthase II
MDQIRLGRADAMVVGGCESSMRSLLTYASFCRRRHARHHAKRPAPAPPSPPTASGFVLAEGAAMLVLERLDLARARGAHDLGRASPAQRAPTTPITSSAPDPSGAAWARTMTLALAEAGVHPDEVDAISAHATATPLGDLAETRAIRRVFGARADRHPGVRDQIHARPRVRRGRGPRGRARGRRHGRRRNPAHHQSPHSRPRM